MNPDNPLAYYFAHTDALGATLFCLLVLMSLAAWQTLLVKALRLWKLQRRARRFETGFWAQPAAPAAAGCPWSRLARAAFAAHAASPGRDEVLLRRMRRVIDDEAERLESGQTLLASVAAVAPFVGLFGTVWGVYHALSAIGSQGAASLEQVAGPVGEALIMTALGLAVAIPALLGYNFAARATRRLLARLDGYAYDLHHYLATGCAPQAEGV